MASNNGVKCVKLCVKLSTPDHRLTADLPVVKDSHRAVLNGLFIV